MSFKCGRRTRRCAKCRYKYKGKHNPEGSDYDLWACPECGHPRACRNPVKREGKACGDHGGDSPHGWASASTVHGRYISKENDLPILSDLVEEFMQDHEYASLTEELALVRARVAQLAHRIEALQAEDIVGVAQREAHKAHTLLGRVMANPSADNAATLLQEAYLTLSHSLEGLGAEEEAWSAALKAIASINQLSGTELTRERLETQYIPATDVILLMEQLRNVVLEVVIGEVERKQVLHQFNLLVAGADE